MNILYYKKSNRYSCKYIVSVIANLLLNNCIDYELTYYYLIVGGSGVAAAAAFTIEL